MRREIMIRRMRSIFSLLTMLFLSTCFAEEAPKKLSEEEITRLIEHLGSPEFDIRERAARQLRDLEEALPALRRAAKSADLEVRRRAKELVASQESRLSERFLRQAVAQVNEEGLDLFLDRMVLQKDYADETRWKAVVELARALSRHAEKAGAAAPKILDDRWLNMPETTTFPGPGMRQMRIRVDGYKGTINSVQNCLLVSSGSLSPMNAVHRSILFVDGDIESINSTRDSILICSGTIKSFNSTVNSIIFCNGDIVQMNHTQGNALFVRGEVRSLNHTFNNVIEVDRFGRDTFFSEGNTFLNRKERKVGNGLRGRNGPPDKYVAVEPSSLTLFQFFDPSRVGLVYSMNEGDAHIDKLIEGKPFAKAGLHKGDRILAVDRTKFVAADVFSQLLRRRVLAGKALLKVQRKDRVLEIPVAFEP